MKTKETALKEYRDMHYLLKCPYCGEELVVSYSELNKQLFKPKEIEDESESFSIVDGKFVDNGKVKHKRIVSSDPSKDVYKGIKCCKCGHIWDELCNGMYARRCNPDGRQVKIFDLDETETEAAKKFIEEHNHQEEFRKQGKMGFSTLGQQFTYTFIPGGLGSTILIKCNHCGKEEDITNYDCW